MQEAELKRREEIRRKKERDEGEQFKIKNQKPEVVVKVDDREPEKIAKPLSLFKFPPLQPRDFKEIKLHKYRFNKGIPEIIVSKLKLPFFQPKELKGIKARIKRFFTEIADIKSIKREIPKIRSYTKQLKGISTKNLAFNIMIPSTPRRNKNLTVPDLTLTAKHFDEFKSKKTYFNLDLLEMSVSKKQVSVPEIRRKTFSRAISRNIPEVLLPKKEITEKSKSEERENAGASEGDAEQKEFELPNLFESLLGKGAGKITEGKPICIIVEKTDEKYEELIAILCRDIFREKLGGKPTPIYIETIKELRHELLVERNIMVV